ncbi:MAG: peptidase domain-containing ABC transporter [Bacteroidales bacterium]|nr:peptidase domain-containing ABC transporter [Bacteroidales bacterium]
MSFPFYKQLDVMDCGPTCLKMVAAYYKRNISIDTIRKRSYITKGGVSFLGLSEAADSLGFKSLGVKIPFEKLRDDVPLPCIVHWRQRHFVVVYKIKDDIVMVADPAIGLMKYDKESFMRNWASTTYDGHPLGLALILEPTPSFYELEDEKEKPSSIRFLLKYFKLYKKYLVQLVLGLILGSVIQLVIPFLTQSIVDIGINNRDIGFIYLILAAQLALIIGRMLVEFIRGWLLLHIGARVNISILSGFLQKLMSLPISFFDTKLTGDIIQRVEDNNRIEDFLTSQSLSVLFSFFNIIVFGIALAILNVKILLIYLIGASLYVLWISLFMKKRAMLDEQRFKQMSKSGSKLINIVNGMQEIKLTQSEQSMRWDWESQQATIFKLRTKSLGLSQYQNAGAVFINETTNLIVTVCAASAVIHGSITLGMMLAIQFIIGQLNVPINQLLTFARSYQDAKMSLDRLNEVLYLDEEESDKEFKIKRLPSNKDIYVNNVSFQYEGPHSPFALKDIDILFESNKTTAIVGASGSGKTTLLKLLLGLYTPVSGEILVGDTNLKNIALKSWRERVGAVMQDGYLFSNTIAYNIAPGVTNIDEDRLIEAMNIANIRGFVESLPLGFNTKIGANGHGLSGGQKQRLLIARVIYKNPDIVIFDEATNSLDAANEKAIVENLNDFFKGKTVITVAHRLSTVKNADKIIVLDGGKIIEIGDHNSLIASKGTYYNLIKNQLELGA